MKCMFRNEKEVVQTGICMCMHSALKAMVVGIRRLEMMQCSFFSHNYNSKGSYTNTYMAFVCVAVSSEGAQRKFYKTQVIQKKIK